MGFFSRKPEPEVLGSQANKYKFWAEAAESFEPDERLLSMGEVVFLDDRGGSGYVFFTDRALVVARYAGEHATRTLNRWQWPTVVTRQVSENRYGKIYDLAVGEFGHPESYVVQSRHESVDSSFRRVARGELPEVDRRWFTPK